MGAQNTFFEAIGSPTPKGFFTNSKSIDRGVDVQGNEVGVRGTCQGPDGPGVLGLGSGGAAGVSGVGGSKAPGVTNPFRFRRDGTFVWRRLVLAL